MRVLPAILEPLPAGAEPDLQLLRIEREVPAPKEIEDPAALLLERQRGASRALAAAFRKERYPQLA